MYINKTFVKLRKTVFKLLVKWYSYWRKNSIRNTVTIEHFLVEVIMEYEKLKNGIELKI